jgi:hypothetical protein
VDTFSSVHTSRYLSVTLTLESHTMTSGCWETTDRVSSAVADRVKSGGTLYLLQIVPTNGYLWVF